MNITQKKNLSVQPVSHAGSKGSVLFNFFRNIRNILDEKVEMVVDSSALCAMTLVMRVGAMIKSMHCINVQF